jgi:1-aminocyclopropane-1-carboxylate deaminase/D-cysteine desulfhydrase
MPASTTWRGLPCLQLTSTPTPLERAERLSAHLGVEVLLKRDDAGALGVAGNKVRKLELLLARAVEDGADTVVILGARQSNAARATAACAARLGLGCHLVVDGDPGDAPAEPEGNLLLDELFGATVHPSGARDWPALDARAAALEDELRAQGAEPYRMPVGGSSPLGALGFARAYEELSAQLAAARAEVAAVYHASSSGGTHAGLLAGRALQGGAGPRIRGIDVGGTGPDMAGLVTWLAGEAGTLIGEALAVEADLDLGHVGPGYAQTTPESLEAIALLAELEGVVTDPVYSGKALAALVADARRGRIGGPVVFWHTGGVPAIFARPYAGALADVARTRPRRSPRP